MALTLIEASKRHSGDVFREGVIETIGIAGSVLDYIPFMDIAGGAYNYKQEHKLPSSGYRGVNQDHTESTAQVKPLVETLKIFGGTVKVDRAILAMNGDDQRLIELQMRLKSMALAFNRHFFKGDSDTDVSAVDGLQKRLTGEQVISAGSTANGTALSLNKLDELIDQVNSPTHLFMNKTMLRLLSASTYNTGVSGYMTHMMDDYGRRISMYNGLPIVVVDEDENGDQVLAFNEAAASGTATATSIYCASIGDGALMGIQNGDPIVEDLGLMDNGIHYGTLVEWYHSYVLLGKKSAARLRNIANASVTA